MSAIAQEFARTKHEMQLLVTFYCSMGVQKHSDCPRWLDCECHCHRWTWVPYDVPADWSS